MRARAGTQASFLRPLDVATLHWGRTYSPRAWAVALIGQIAAQPGITDWHELLSVAEDWLCKADWPEREAGVAYAGRVEQLLDRAGDQASALARAAVAATLPLPTLSPVTHNGDEIGCAVCGAPLAVRSGSGRPARYCSPACRTRAWRDHTTRDAKP